MPWRLSLRDRTESRGGGKGGKGTETHSAVSVSRQSDDTDRLGSR